jgi:hypothetical protein
VADSIDFSVVFSMLNRKADAEGAPRRAAHGTVVIALDREDLNRLLAGGCLNFTVGTALSSNSQIQIAFGETDARR